METVGIAAARWNAEFGVYDGRSIRTMRNALHDASARDSTKYPYVWGFDSFEGLPEEDPSNSKQKDWSPGKYK